MQTKYRDRLGYAVAALAVIAAGLLLRSQLLSLPQIARKYGGDALWAGMVYLFIRFIQPRAGIWKCAAIAFAFSVCVEVSQLYHAEWIDGIRRTRLGALVLGRVFNWPDIPAYGLGVLVVAMVDRAVRQR